MKKNENEFFISPKTSVIGLFKSISQIYDNHQIFSFFALGNGIEKLLWIVEIVKVKFESNN